MKRRPKIGLTMRLETSDRRFYLGRDYSEALHYFGALPVHIPLIPDEDFIAHLVKDLDGILLPGCDSDVDPLLYGEEPKSRLGKVVSEKDQTDLYLLAAAEFSKMPVLAICFGMQILNVFRGGNLFQDIESELPNCLKHEQGIPQNRNSHSILIEQNSLISELCGNKTDKIAVNSSHHQAVRTVGENLKITARAKDGVIESIEDVRDDRFALGVQWHPELSWQKDVLSANIFKAFVEVCAE